MARNAQHDKERDWILGTKTAFLLWAVFFAVLCGDIG